MTTRFLTMAVTTDASGDATVYSGPHHGKLQQLRYKPASSNELDTGADVTITLENSGFVLYQQSNIGTSAFSKAPRQATHDTAGTALLYAAGGTAVSDRMSAGGERIKLVIAQGGNAKSGTFYLWLEE